MVGTTTDGITTTTSASATTRYVSVGVDGGIGGRRSLIKPPSIIPILFNVTCFIGLICYHVHADETSTSTTTNSHIVPTNNNNDDNSNHNDPSTTTTLSLWKRIINGPSYLTTMDKILFGVLVLLGMELLNYISSNIGCKYSLLQ